jgi:chitin disaccharide deacetylase
MITVLWKPVIQIKQLIINVDDFGLDPDINSEIIESHCHSCVTSITIRAGGEAFHHAVALAKQFPYLSVGAHLLISYKGCTNDNTDCFVI